MKECICGVVGRRPLRRLGPGGGRSSLITGTLHFTTVLSPFLTRWVKNGKAGFSWTTGPESVSGLQNERVLGYFPAGGLFRGYTVYVTTNRIIINRGRGKSQVDWRAHFLLSLLLALVPVVPAGEAVIILLGVVTMSVVFYMKRRRYRRKWPTMDSVERGRRWFEMGIGSLLGIELKPGRLQRAQMTISSLSGEHTLKILGKKNFKIATQLLGRFAAGRVKIVD